MIERVAWAVLLAACVNFFIVFTPTSSFWLDETVTAWVVQDSWSEIAERVFLFQAQSPLYYWLVGSVARLFGMSEWALRMPSWIFGFASAALLFRIARRNLSQPATIAVVLIMLAHAEFDRAFLNARPYMMAFFFALCSIELFQQWLRAQRVFFLILSTFLALLSFYAHYLFAFSLAPLLFVILFSWKRQQKLPYLILVVSTIVAITLMVPGILHLGRIGRHASEYAFAPTLSLYTLAGALVPLEIAVVLVMSAALLFAFCSTLTVSVTRIDLTFLRKISWWIVIPPFVMTVFSLTTGHSLLVGRYYLLAVAGIALGGGILVDCIDDIRQRYVFCLILGVFSLFIHRWEFENWSAVAQHINNSASPQSLTLLHSGLREGEYDNWLSNERNQIYLTAPFQVYSVAGAVMPIPQYWEDHQRYQDIIFSRIKQSMGKVFIVNLRSPREHRSPEWSASFRGYQEILREKNYLISNYWRDGLIEAAEIVAIPR